MSTQSTNTKRSSHRRYVPGSSRGTRSATTLLAQVADIERGTRIRERREELHLTQPAVVEMLEEAAKALPSTHDLHPNQLGKAPVTLRGYQTYEQGGGIVWEKAKLLAQVLRLDVQAMMNGEAEKEPTPSPFAGRDEMAAILAEVREQLRENQRQLRENHEALRTQTALLEEIKANIAAERAAKTGTDESTRRLLAAADDASRILRDASQRQAAARGKQAKSG